MSEESGALVLGGSNVLELRDKTSGKLLEFHYRFPTQSERDAYQKATMKRKGNKILTKSNVFPEQTALGKCVLLGFKKGCLANEAGQIISSDKTDPAYDPNWKGLLAKWRPDILAVVGRMAINPTSTPDEENNFEVVEDLGDDPLSELLADTSTDAEDPTSPLPSA